MLSKDDTKWIKDNRKSIVQNREMPLTLIGETVTGYHPLTKEPIVEIVNEPTMALVTEIVSAFKVDRKMESGVDIDEGDLWVDLSVDDFDIDYRDIINIRYHKEEYTVLAADRAGIGVINRIIIIARKTK